MEKNIEEPLKKGIRHANMRIQWRTSLQELPEALIGLYATYVDETLHAGNWEYLKLCDKTEQNFKCKKRAYSIFNCLD